MADEPTNGKSFSCQNGLCFAFWKVLRYILKLKYFHYSKSMAGNLKDVGDLSNYCSLASVNVQYPYCVLLFNKHHIKSRIKFYRGASNTNIQEHLKFTFL